MVTVSQLVIYILSATNSYTMSVCCVLADIWRPFAPAFIKRVKSAYRDEWSFRTANTQRDALALSSDDDIRHDASLGGCVGLMPAST